MVFKLLVGSHNLGKQAEFKQQLKSLDIEILVPQDIDATRSLQVTESGQTICKNAYLKAREFALRSGVVAVADDSCLEIDALDGQPGVNSKRFFSGNRNQEIIKRMNGQKNRAAKFKACLCLVDPSNPKQPRYFEGEVTGTISYQELGTAGFDYDRIFIPQGYQHTFAQLGMKIKNQVSHRTQALNQLKVYLNNYV